MKLGDRFLEWIRPWIDRQMSRAQQDSDWSYGDWIAAQQRYQKLYQKPWHRH